MPVKVKELKDNALIDIKVNKSFYLMVKAVSFYLYNQINEDNKEEYLKTIVTESYDKLDSLQQSFYTLALLLAEIEEQAKKNNLYDEKEVLQPGDEGYVPPTLD